MNTKGYLFLRFLLVRAAIGFGIPVAIGLLLHITGIVTFPRFESVPPIEIERYESTANQEAELPYDLSCAEHRFSSRGVYITDFLDTTIAELLEERYLSEEADLVVGDEEQAIRWFQTVPNTIEVTCSGPDESGFTLVARFKVSEVGKVERNDFRVQVLRKD